MSGWAAKRFWTEARVASATGGYGVELDGRTVRTPAKAALIVPTRALAQGIAAEWAAQEGLIAPATMPLTRAANVTIDRVAQERDAVAAMLADYGGSDLLCYRAEAPEALIARQAAAWDPLLDWAESVFSVRLRRTGGVMPVQQDAATLDRLRAEVRMTLTDGRGARTDACEACTDELTQLCDIAFHEMSPYVGIGIARLVVRRANPPSFGCS